jgi:hypothetical protein
MPDWSDGYVTNIDYTSGFYPRLSPHARRRGAIGSHCNMISGFMAPR